VDVPRTVLLVGLAAEVAERLLGGLVGRGFACEGVGYEEGFELLELVPFDAVVASFPFPREIPMTRFMTRLRKRSSACRHAALILLTGEFSRPEAEDLVGRGANLVFPASVDADELARAIRAVTGAAARVPLLALVHVEVRTEQGLRRLVAQCENVSETGIFLRMGQALPVGSTVVFELVLPDSGYRLRGEGTVVRHGIGSRGGQEGIALRFGELGNEARERLASFVGRQSPHAL